MFSNVDKLENNNLMLIINNYAYSISTRLLIKPIAENNL